MASSRDFLQDHSKLTVIDFDGTMTNPAVQGKSISSLMAIIEKSLNCLIELRQK